MNSFTWKASIGAVALTALLTACSVPLPLVGAVGTANPQSQVEAVIQKANQEQQQAFSQNNSQLMSDTATASYYQQLAQDNTQMQSGGVKSIQLINLQWGQVTVNGNTAQAATQETWRTTFTDGTVDQSTAQNAYTLVNQNGSWLIQSDTQRRSNVAKASQPTAPITTPPTITQNSSANWAGYAATGGTFTAVSGTWTIPQSASGTGADATWVGIGGVKSTDLIQAGTQEVASGGDVQYQAWIETLPQASQQVPLVVNPGDSVSVTLNEQSSGQWLITIKNNTTGQTYSATETYTSSESSAEWIEEAPSGGRSVLPLDNFGTLTFSAGSTVENGKTVSMSGANAQPINMIDGARQPVAVPSSLSNNGDSFTVSRTAASSSAEPVPGTGRGVGNPTGVTPAFGAGSKS
jgi:hypothetical protein